MENIKVTSLRDAIIYLKCVWIGRGPRIGGLDLDRANCDHKFESHQRSKKNQIAERDPRFINRGQFANQKLQRNNWR